MNKLLAYRCARMRENRCIRNDPRVGLGLGLAIGRRQSRIEHTMKSLSMQKILVVGALTISLVACGSAPMSKESASPEPISPPPPTETAISPDEFPADLVEVKETKTENRPNAPITMPLVDKPTKESDLGQAKPDDFGEGHARGPSDPLAGPVLSTSQGERATGSDGGGSMFGGVPGGIASNARGGAQTGHGTSTTGGTGTTGNGIAAATEVRGTIDKAEIQRVVRAHLNDVKRCYELGLQRRPDLEGKVVLKFTIGKTGTVVAATVALTTLNERQVEQCIVSAAMRWTFPKPTGEGLAVISYPFILKSAE